MYYAAEVEAQLCTGCALCAMGCPDPNVIAYCKDSETVTVDQKRCKGCGICINLCKKDAMSVKQVNLIA
jgi:Pyruvate/2-oxoacid:ferredoxin oxidoreductase delta subunit